MAGEHGCRAGAWNVMPVEMARRLKLCRCNSLTNNGTVVKEDKSEPMLDVSAFCELDVTWTDERAS